MKRSTTRALVLGALAIAALGATVHVAMAGSGHARKVVASEAAISASAPCGGLTTPPATFQHVITIIEENHSYSQAIGPEPYQTSLAKSCGLASNYYALSYPSLPNYVGMTSGAIPSSVANKDCTPTGSCVTSSNSIFQQVGTSWKVYAESMPSNCSRLNTSNGLYVPRHTAAPYYTAENTNCTKQSVPLGTTTTGALQADLANGTLPKFSFVAPNTTNDAHGGCMSCADNWLKTWVPKIIASPAYQNGSTVLFITYDSDAKNSGNHVATIVVSPYTKAGTVSATKYTHYSLLRTEEELLGVTTYLGGANTAASMKSAFHL